MSQPRELPCIVLLAEGFEEIEALTVVDVLCRAGLNVRMLAIGHELDVEGSHGITVRADGLLADLDPDAPLAAVIAPGGLPGSEYLRDDPAVIALFKRQAAAGGITAAICAAPIVLEAAGLTAGRCGTSYPGFEEELSFDSYESGIVVEDGNLITSRGPATALPFALAIAARLAGRETAIKLAEGMLLTRLSVSLPDWLRGMTGI
ncbi:MAG: DJ-1/PfpI family protein [Bacillota bacterium]|nr:DJ-1/PfpI family protein [Bacillota bacterium]